MSSVNLGASLACPLTPYELKLAEAQRIKNAGDRFFTALKAVMNGTGSEDEFSEASAALNELGGLRALTAFMNRGQGFVQQDFGFVDVTTGKFISVFADPGITANDYNLPWMFSGAGSVNGGTDTLNNSLLLTRGLSMLLMSELEEEYIRLQIPTNGREILAYKEDGSRNNSVTANNYI